MPDHHESNWAALGAVWQDLGSRAAKLLANFEDNLQFIEAGVQRLAKEGWPIHRDLDAQQVVGLIAVADELGCSRAFGELYDCDAGQEVGRALAQMRSSPRMAKWTNLLTELEQSLRDGRHVICVPALVTMLEGLAFPTPTNDHWVKEAIRSHAQRVVPNPSNALEPLIWSGITGFVNELFARSDFTGHEPRLNRHWILHGRAIAGWTREDSIRLLHTVRVLDESLGELDAAQGNPQRKP